MKTLYWEVRTLVHRDDLKPTIILISSATLLAIHRYFGSMEFALHTLGVDRSLTSSLFMFVSAFVLMSIIPLIIIVFVFKENPRMYGMRLGRWKEGGMIAIILLPVIAVLLLYPASHSPEIRAFYPMAPEAFDSWSNFLSLQLSRGVLFYFSWEFFFRGFMLFGLRKYVGDWLAICIQMIPQCLWHIGMPTGETFSSIASGILLGFMAIRTGSFLWPLLLHFGIGVSLDILIFLQS